jgi:hypothetical protein
MRNHDDFSACNLSTIISPLAISNLDFLTRSGGRVLLCQYYISLEFAYFLLVMHAWEEKKKESLQPFRIHEQERTSFVHHWMIAWDSLLRNFDCHCVCGIFLSCASTAWLADFVILVAFLDEMMRGCGRLLGGRQGKLIPSLKCVEVGRQQS